ncbi:matrimony [Musca autumnalis]|uniref:matrimony n=1 Tax=Musca autumnalis TaxID=221902 RepID=UPI003CF90DB2
MEDCRTPTLAAPREFIFNVTPTMINNSASYYQDVHNIMANMRTYTPIHTEVRSPGISPIFKLANSLSSPVTTHHSSSFKQFKKPSLIPKPVVASYTPSPKFSDKTANHFLSPCPSFMGASNFTTTSSSSSPSGSYHSLNNSSISGGGDSSSPHIMANESNASILNHTLTINLLLKTLGLERYCEKFENAGIDCNNLMNIKTTDLKGIGIKSDDCERIMEMFDHFYAS